MTKFSFIIPSLNRPGELRDCIDSIEKAYDFKQDAEVEILVILQSRDDYHAVMPNKYPQLLRKYYVEQKGLARARNFGITVSKGDLLIFIDDDARIKDDFLYRLSQATRDFKSDAYCGRILEDETGKCFGECFKDDGSKSLNWLDFRYFMGSAHILTRGAVEKIGLYDEKFGAGSRYPAAEESDIFFRLRQRNLEIVYLPELIFYHRIAEKVAGSKVFAYHRACGAMLIKQILNDPKRGLIYLFIIIEIVLKSLIRVIQNILFPKTIKAKNERYHYLSVFLGVISGVIGYIKDFSLKLKKL